MSVLWKLSSHLRFDGGSLIPHASRSPAVCQVLGQAVGHIPEQLSLAGGTDLGTVLSSDCPGADSASATHTLGERVAGLSFPVCDMGTVMTSVPYSA